MRLDSNLAGVFVQARNIEGCDQSHPVKVVEFKEVVTHGPYVCT